MGAQSHAAGGYAALFPTEQARAASMLNMVAGMPPQMSQTSIADLSDYMNTLDMLRRYKSMAEEQEITPETAAARQSMRQAMADQAKMAATGQLAPALQRALMTEALRSQRETGIPLTGSFGQSNLAALFGRGAFGLQQNLQNQVNQWLATQQAPIGGIDPSSAANLRLSEAEKNRQAQNQWMQQLLGTAGQGQAGLSQLGMGAMQGAVSEDLANTAARNQLMGTLLGGMMGVAGGALGGPLGGALGRSLFSTPAVSTGGLMAGSPNLNPYGAGTIVG